jgi:Matrixin
MVAAMVAAGSVPAAAAADRPAYKFFKAGANPRSPGAYWNPCESVRYGIDFTYATRKGMKKSWERARWQSAIAEVGQAMGMDFRYAGAIRSKSAGTYPRPVPGVDLIITFGYPGKGRYGYGRVLKGSVAGFAGISWRSSRLARKSQVDRGYVVIDAKEVVRRTDTWRAPLDTRPVEQRSPDVVRALYMHEFGHAVGLDHVRDQRQLMYPQLQANRPDTLGAGDRKGLRKLGDQRCF